MPCFELDHTQKPLLSARGPVSETGTALCQHGAERTWGQQAGEDRAGTASFKASGHGWAKDITQKHPACPAGGMSPPWEQCQQRCQAHRAVSRPQTGPRSPVCDAQGRATSCPPRQPTVSRVTHCSLTASTLPQFRGAALICHLGDATGDLGQFWLTRLRTGPAPALCALPADGAAKAGGRGRCCRGVKQPFFLY